MLLDAAESHLALGNTDQAKALIAEAREAVRQLAQSESLPDRQYAERLEPLIEALEKDLSGK